jgi:predicted GIY-YIG superfamily endonuclease
MIFIFCSLAFCFVISSDATSNSSWPGLVVRRTASLRFAYVPAIHVLQHQRMRAGYVYFMTYKPNGILYAGVTSNLVQRVYQHRTGVVAGFTKRYGLKRLVYFEAYDDIANRDPAREDYQAL